MKELPLPKQLYEKLISGLKSYKIIKIYLSIYKHRVISNVDLQKETSISLNDIDELMYQYKWTKLIQKYCNDSGDVVYMPHIAVLNANFACTGCKYVQYKKVSYEGFKPVKMPLCTLTTIKCHNEYYRNIKNVKKSLQCQGYKLSSFREVLKHTDLKIDESFLYPKKLIEWKNKDFVNYVYQEYHKRYKKQITHTISKTPIARFINAFCAIISEKYPEDTNFFIYRYINYSFEKADQEGFRFNWVVASKPNIIREFMDNCKVASCNKCTKYKLYCPYFKNEKCIANVKCTKSLRSKIKEHYN